MDHSHLDQLVELEDSYWWHVAKRQLVQSLLEEHFPTPGRIVEGGIGSGRNLIEFQKMGYQVTGFDIMHRSVVHCFERGLNDCCVHDLGQPWPLPDQSARAVVLLDVLEHLEHPVQVLRHAHRILETGGGVVATVPAYPWLFSQWDERLGHYRRYTAEDFRRHSEEAGFSVSLLSHWNAFTLPAAVAVRGIDRVFPCDRPPNFPAVSPGLNRLLLRAAAVERWCLKRVGIPAGLSLVGVLGK